ncbi:hypothetical protein EU537_04920 [Candidatus Thorarchaeota archaeon]|nr:MAG: hypothetical protein EU537_04920 [Candidatus Thorarchaeota archaeon]
MAVAAPSYGLFTAIVLFLIFSLYFNPWNRKLRNPRNSLLLIIVTTSLAIPLQVWYNYDVAAYNTGSTYLSNLYVNASLLPGEKYEIHHVSNWYAERGALLEISNESQGIIFYLVDENIRGTRFNEFRLNESMFGFDYPHAWFGFKLPYYRTSLFQIANWTVCFSNPLANETIPLKLRGVWIEDSGNLASWSVYHPRTQPVVALLCLWIFVPLILMATNSVSIHQLVENLRLLIPAMLLVVIYLLLSLPFISSIIFFDLYLVFPLPIVSLVLYYVIKKQEDTTQ